MRLVTCAIWFATGAVVTLAALVVYATTGAAPEDTGPACQPAATVVTDDVGGDPYALLCLPSYPATEVHV